MNQVASMPAFARNTDAEHAMVMGMRGGDHEAFSKLYRHYAPALLGYILRITRDEQSSEDVLKKVFIAIWNKKHEFCPESGRLFTWMLQITKSIAVGFVPKTRYMDHKRSWSHDIEENTNDKVFATNSMNTLHARILELMHFNNYSIEEAAGILKVGDNTVRSALRSAIGKLKTVK